jgi:hypothetical protein
MIASVEQIFPAIWRQQFSRHFGYVHVQSDVHICTVYEEV